MPQEEARIRAAWQSDQAAAQAAAEAESARQAALAQAALADNRWDR